MKEPITTDTNRGLWAEPPHHRPDKQLYMPDPDIPLHEQTLLGVKIPPQTKAQQNERDWELTDADVRHKIGDEILAEGVTPETNAAYETHKAELNATSAKIAATVRQLEKEQHERFREQYPQYSQPEPVRSDSYNRIRRIVG